MRPTEVRVKLTNEGRSEVHINGVRVPVKSISISAAEGGECEVALVMSGCNVNSEYGGPDAPAQDELPLLGSVFKSLCSNCGKLFSNGDGHVCS